MAIVQHKGKRVFEYSFKPIRINDAVGAKFEVVCRAAISDVGNDEFLTLCDQEGLRVGLKLFEGDSRSAMIAEFRALQVLGGSEPGTVRARFSIPRSLFAAQQCRLAKLDLLYENTFWFEEVLGPSPFLPIWVEKSAEAMDVFEYYQRKYLNK